MVLVTSNEEFDLIFPNNLSCGVDIQLALYNRIILHGNYQQCTSVSIELQNDFTSHDCESKALGNALAGLIFNGSSNIKPAWVGGSTCHWIWRIKNHTTQHQQKTNVVGLTGTTSGTAGRKALVCQKFRSATDSASSAITISIVWRDRETVPYKLYKPMSSTSWFDIVP